MSQPLVSIVIPFYNTDPQQAETLVLSVLKQSYENLEIICINDGSTDNTPQLLEKFQKQDKRINLINQKNSGSAAGARNSGLQKATGEYVMFVDSDDEVDPKFVEKMLNKIQKESSDLVACGFKYHRLANESSVDIFTNKVATRNHNEDFLPYTIRLLGNDGRLYSVVNKIFRTDLIKKNQLKFDTSLDFGEDLIFVLNYLKHSERIAFVYEALYLYNYGTATSTVSKSSLKPENWQKNWRFLTNWFLPKNPYETDSLNWIRYRWAYSYCLAVCRSSKTFRQKYTLLQKAPKKKDLPKVGKIRNIGRSKYFQEKIYQIVNKNTFLLFVFSSFFVKIRLDS